MSINTNVIKSISVDKNLDALISQFENHEISFEDNTPALPDEVWVGILKRLTWTDLQRAGPSCKYIFVIAQTIFKQHRQRWAEAFPEASQWPIPKFIHEVEVKPLYVEQPVLLTFARIMGIDRYRKLPVLEGYVDQITPDQMTAPIMRGIAIADRTIQFLAIKCKNDSDAESIFVETIVNIENVIGRFRMMFTGEQNQLVRLSYVTTSNAELCSNKPLPFLRDYLPMLLCKGVLYIKEDARIHYPRYQQINLV